MKTKIVENVVVLTSALKAEDIELLKKCKPDALKLKNEDGNEVFGISYDKKGGFNKYGLTFDRVNDNGFASYNFECEGKRDEIVKSISETIGSIAGYVAQIEKTAAAEIQSINTAKAEFVSNIEFC